MEKPRIALTMGDPSGIGPEIVVKAAADAELRKIADLVIYGCPDIIETAAARFAPKTRLNIEITGTLKFDELSLAKIDPVSGLAAHSAVIAATHDALAGKVDALVTAPINKASVNAAGIPFTGHTELIAE
ncbi:MAG: 4-hydroxythreonine-4-phosphate dehydrogenase PdxA, partial [Victivallaceae bacterium]|nr:4-hydroxythreonine-4-phosphate dehydrogenase PdxA [Victivallaceae bacterium]